MMSWQGFGRDISSQASSSNIPVLHPGMNAADLESQQVYFHSMYPPPPVNTTSIPADFRYTTSDYYPPATPVDEFTNQYLEESYPETADFHKPNYSSSTNFAYMPGMPVHTNHFGHAQFGLAGESSTESFVENQWAPKMPWSERGKYSQPYRGRGSNKFQNRGRVYKNTHNDSYSVYHQGSYYDRDDYYYDTPHYDYYNPHNSRRGRNGDGGQRAREDDFQDQFRLGDGDGKPHGRKNNNRAWFDQHDVVESNGAAAVANNKLGKHGQNNRYSKTLINQAFDSRALRGDDLPISHTTPVNNRKARDSMNKENESHTDLVSHVEEIIAGKVSKSELFLGKESKEKEVNAELNRDQASYNRGRGYTSVHSMRRGNGVTSRSSDGKRYKNGIQESPENDESQRGNHFSLIYVPIFIC